MDKRRYFSYGSNDNSLSIESYSPDDHIEYTLEVTNEFGVIKTREFTIGISITTDWEISFDHTLNDVIPTVDGAACWWEVPTQLNPPIL